MGFPDLRRASMSLLMLLLAAAPVYLTQEHVTEEAQQSQDQIQENMFPIKEEELKQAIKEVLAQYNTIVFPGIPVINIPGDKVSISMSLADIYLQGLSDTRVKFKPGIGFHPRAHVNLLFYKLSLLVGSYTSSGHILNLPFNGEGPMYLHLHDLSLDFSVEWGIVSTEPFIVCAKYNTTAYDLDLRRMETHFENLNLNEGADLGQVVDIVLPSFGQDIVEGLQLLVTTKYYKFLDSILVRLINTVSKCTSESIEDILKTDELMKVLYDIAKDMVPQ